MFYTHKARKESVWTVPEEIKDALETLEREEAEEKLKAEKEKEEKEREREVERVVKEAQKAAGKRKAQEIEPVEEVVISKRARTEDGDEEDGDEAESDEESEEEEEWQREAAAQLAAEAEVERKRKEEEQKREQEEEQARLKAEAEAQKNRPLNMPNRVDLSLEEAKALFKVRIWVHICNGARGLQMSRHSYGKRMLIHCILGTRPFLCLCRTRGTSCCRTSLREKKRSTSTVGNAHGNSARIRSSTKRPSLTPRRSLRLF